MMGVAHFNGAVAQLGERLLCKQEVIGSIPFGSTSYSDLSRKNEIESERRRRAFGLFFGCLTLLIGCKARLDAQTADMVARAAVFVRMRV